MKGPLFTREQKEAQHDAINCQYQNGEEARDLRQKQKNIVQYK